MLRKIAMLSFIFLTFNAKSQSPEAIGEYLYEAFKTNRTTLTKYLDDSTLFMKELNETYRDWNEKDTLIYYSEKLYGKFFERSKKAMNDWWLGILKCKRKCGLAPFVKEYEVQKEANKNVGRLHPNEAVYLVIFGKNQFAIRFHTTTIEGRTYIDELGGGEIYYLNEQSGIFSCTSTCKDGTPDDQGCLEAID